MGPTAFFGIIMDFTTLFAAFSFLQNADPRSVVPPHAKRSSTAPPSVQNAGHHQSFSSTTQRLHLLRHHPPPALHLSALPISHSQQFLPLSHPQFLSPTTLSTPGFLPPEFPRLLLLPSLGLRISAYSWLYFY
ncbi:hypothetical protein ACJW30_10G071200 [Castanea mollissima]